MWCNFRHVSSKIWVYAPSEKVAGADKVVVEDIQKEVPRHISQQNHEHFVPFWIQRFLHHL